jgi:hypothetical protein
MKTRNVGITFIAFSKDLTGGGQQTQQCYAYFHVTRAAYFHPGIKSGFIKTVPHIPCMRAVSTLAGGLHLGARATSHWYPINYEHPTRLLW